MKGLRKILRMQTTFMDRTNTNAKVISEANRKMEEEGCKKQVMQFSEAYRKAKTKHYVKLITSPEDEPSRCVTFASDMRAWEHTNRRQGRPKLKWANETAKEYWEQNCGNLAAEYHHTNWI